MSAAAPTYVHEQCEHTVLHVQGWVIGHPDRASHLLFDSQTEAEHLSCSPGSSSPFSNKGNQVLEK